MRSKHMTVLRVGCVVALAIASLIGGFAPVDGLWMAPLLLGEVTTTTDLDAGMKILFEDSIVNDVVSDSELLDLFEMDTNVQEEESTGGRYIETAQYFGLPAGVGARHENDYIPVPGGPEIENSRIYLKKVLGAVEMTGDTMKRVRTSEGAFLNWADRALPDLVTRLKNELDRMLLGYGAGIKARVDDGAPDATLGVDSAFGIASRSQVHLQFLKGESVVFSANATGNPLRSAGAGQSAKVLRSEKLAGGGWQLTLDALPAGVVDDDFIFEGDDSGFGGQGASGSDREPMGLLGLVDDGTILATFQNIVRADHELWQSIVFDASAAPFAGVLTEDLLTEADDETFTEGGGEMDVFVCSRRARRGYWQSLRTDRTINDPRAFTGGMASTSIILGDREIPIKVARKMPDEIAFGLQTDTIKKWMLGVFEWDDTTGSIWKQVVDSQGRKDAFWAYGHMYLQLGCLAPRKNFKLVGISN